MKISPFPLVPSTRTRLGFPGRISHTHMSGLFCKPQASMSFVYIVSNSHHQVLTRTDLWSPALVFALHHGFGHNVYWGKFFIPIVWYTTASPAESTPVIFSLGVPNPNSGWFFLGLETSLDFQYLFWRPCHLQPKYSVVATIPCSTNDDQDLSPYCPQAKFK